MKENEKLISKIKNLSVQKGISSNEVQLAKDLVENKCKDESLFIVEGLWGTDKLISKNFEIVMVLYSEEIIKNENEKSEKLQNLLKIGEKSASFCIISEKSCKKISDRDGFDDCFVIVKKPQLSLADLDKILAGKNEYMGIIMDGLEQPGNIGAILRSFDASGGDFAILVNKKAKLNNSRLVRSSLGASFMLPCIEADIDETQKFLENNKVKCIVTDLSAKNSYKDIDYSGKIAIVVGNEHTGISSSWRKLKNAVPIIIPMLGSVESLNVGFAATLVSYEAGLTRIKDKQK